MRKLIVLFLACALHAADVQIFMSPGEMEKELVALIEKEEAGIQVAVYTFTNKRIAEALIKAQKKGVAVDVFIDPFSLKAGYAAQQLIDADVNVYKYAPKAQKGWTPLCHHKFCTFEKQQAVWTGSYNFTYKAESTNRENAVLITGDELSFKRYVEEFRALKEGESEQLKKSEKSTMIKTNGK